MNEAVKLTAKALGVEFCKVLWLDKENQVLRLVAGVGWKEGLVGKATVGLGRKSQAGYTLEVKKPVIVKDLRNEKRFTGPGLLVEHGVVAGVSVPLIFKDTVYGVMGAHTSRRREFTESEVNFLESMANILTASVARKQAEDKLKEYAAKLEHSNKLKEIFIDIMRHDLQNPVSVIKGLSELLQYEESKEKLVKGLETIHANALKIMEMIDNASKLAKYEAMDDLEFEKRDLGAVLKEVITNFEYQSSRKGIEIEYCFNGNYQALINPAIEEVFSNLLSNAIKYSPDNSRIWVRIEDAGKEWRVSVADQGIGVPDEYKEAIFQRFKRLEKNGVKGSGLGLAIVKRIVDLHGGRVWVEDNKPKGSIFYVTIPKA
jgi:signal transduction histidine kinase